MRVTHSARKTLRCAPWTLLLLLLVVGSARGADPGDTGANFLKIGVGARAAAMGEAYVAVAQDPTATYWNPAGIATVPGTQLSATHLEWIGDVRYEYLAAVHGMKGHAVGGFIGLLHMGEIDGRDDNGVFTGSFRAYDTTAGITYARRFARSVELGVSAKVIYQRIGDFDAVGGALDGGIRYRTRLKGLTLAGTFSNFGTDMKFVEQSFVLPTNARVGAAYRTRRVLQGFILSTDLQFPNDSGTKGHIGGELWVHEMIALRGGAKFGYDEEAGSLGFGLKYRQVLFDYSYTPFSDSSELGDTHRISIGWNSPVRKSGAATPSPSGGSQG